LRAASALADHYSETSVSILTDSTTHARAVPSNLDLFLDINPHMNRTGIPIADFERIEAVAGVAARRMRGLHAYEGHIHDPTASQRARHAEEGYRELLDVVAQLSSKGFGVAELVTSGTPTFLYAYRFFEPAAFERAGVGPIPHQVSPGTVVFFDYDYGALLDDLPLTPAALLLARVVSHPAPALATIDVGSKSLACEVAPPLCYVVGYPELVPTKPSEEHLPLFLDGIDPPPLGAELWLVPRHICPTVNLAEEALIVESDGSCDVVRVVARSHDLLVD
jgi:D-serine deaminase-like pyridoxal phosphate-dependent protein